MVGPRAIGVAMASCETEIGLSGQFRYIMQNPDGSQIAFSGEYTRIIPGERIEYTQVFEPMANAGAAELIVTFTAKGTQTIVVSTDIYPSAEVRDEVMISGMEEGMRNTIDQVDDMVVALAGVGAF